MKKTILLILSILLFTALSYAQEYKVVTIVESIVPMGLGRSRIVETQAEISADALSTERTEGNDSKQGKVKRKDAKADEFKETKLLNFYSAVGINFRNIASNDAIITSKIMELAQEGWTLAFVTSAVEADSGETDGKGIFITRLFFTR